MNIRRGFTLIELLLVIAITSLLASIVMGSLNDARERGRIAGLLQFESTIYHRYGESQVIGLTFENGTSTDSSGFGNTVNLSGIPLPTYAEGVSGTSLNFPVSIASAPYVIINNAGSSRILQTLGDHDNYSVSFFFKTAVEPGLPSGYKYISTAKGSGCSTYPWFIRLMGPGVGHNQLDVRLVDTAANSILLESLGFDQYFADNKWHHLLLSRDYDNREVRFYVDGILQDTESTAGTNEDFSCSATYSFITLSNMVSTDEEGWVGEIDQFRIYQDAVEF